VSGVDPKLLEILCCPACRGPLGHDAESAELRCRPCAHTYPIVDGIPVLFPLDVKSHMDELFERYWDSEARADEYDRFVEGAQSRLDMHNHRGEVRATLEVLGDVSGRRVLDCGCGNGRFFEEFPAATFTVGIDASLNLLRICRQKGRCTRLVCGELEHLPFADRSFDTVLSVRVLQHLEQQRQAVFEMARVLRPGGELLLHLYNDLSSKAAIKRIRMSRRWGPILNAPFRALFRSMSPFAPWPLDYDLYNSVPQVSAWLRSCGVEPQALRGAGFGFNKWLLDGLLIAAWLESHRPQLLQRYLAGSLRLEEALGRLRPFNYFMEKFVLKGVKAPESAPRT
jgi:ubiquinone/menaquinone biosynthesis C-methylase UbiE/uncharacterized protein YbaR (Trm112 family)